MLYDRCGRRGRWERFGAELGWERTMLARIHFVSSQLMSDDVLVPE